MIGILVVTHGNVARELVNALEMIIGEQERVEALSIDWEVDVDEAKGHIGKAIALRLAKDGADIALVDLNQDKLDAAVAKVLEAVPELCGGAGTGSTGNFARRSGNAEDALDAKIRENIMGAY